MSEPSNLLSNPLLAGLGSEGGAAPVPPTEQSLTPPEMGNDPSMAIPQRPAGTGIAEQPQKPQDRKDFFRNMLSTFLYSFASGAANSGTGPGADVRGAGAAILAPHQLAMQQQQVGMQQQQLNTQAQQAASLEMLRQAQAQGIPAGIQEKLDAARLAGQNKLDVQGMKNTEGTNVQQIKAKAGQGIADTKANQAAATYKLMSDTRLKIAAGQQAVQRAKASISESKVPPALGKYYSDLQDSVSRANVMQENLKAALKGDQQAMLSLLANHMGMTMGLAKGARINQAMINEAESSAPQLGRIQSRFDSRGYLTGVTLTPEQMQSMVSLATGRLEQDQRKFKEMEAYLAPGKASGTPAATPKNAQGIRVIDLTK